MTRPDVSSYLYVLILLFVSSNHIRIACGQEQPGRNDGHLTEYGNNEGQFTQPGGSGGQAIQPAMNQRQPMRSGDSQFQSIQLGGNVGQSMQPGESRVQSVQPGLNWRQPGQSSGNWGPQIQPGGKEGQSTSPSDNRKQPTQFGWIQGQSGQQGGTWRPPMQTGGFGVRPMQPGGSGSPPMRPGWNKGQPGQPGGNWNLPMQTGGTGGPPMKPGGNVRQPLPSGGIWRPPLQLGWNSRPVMPQPGTEGNRLPQFGFPVGPNRVGNKQQQSDPPTKYQRIQSIFKLVSRNLNYQRVTRTVLLLGNPASGKTTLTLLLTGETNLTLGQEALDKSFIFEDPFGRIGNRTTYPEEFKSPKNLSLYDWPPLGYNEDEDEVEIAYVSRANEAYNSIETFRVLLVLRQCYKACSIGEKIGTAYHSLTNLARLLTDFEWYKDSVGIVYNKVANNDGSPATEREVYVKVLQEVLEGVKKMAMQDIKKTDDPNVVDYLERTIEFADLLRDDSKIAVFPAPSQLTEKPLEDVNIVQGLQEIDTLLKSLDCTVKRETLYHPMSSDVESTVRELKEYTTKSAVKSVTQSFRTVAFELRRQGEKKFGIHDKMDFYLSRKATLDNATRNILDSSTLSDLLLAFRQVTKKLSITLSFSESSVGLRLTSFANFFAGLSGSEIVYDSSSWLESFSYLSQFVSEKAAWYDYLVDVYESFSEETFQQSKHLYNVSDIKNWGTGPEGTGLEITSDNFQDFFAKTSELIPSLGVHHTINSTIPNEQQLTDLNVVITETVRSVVETTCDGKTAITKGNFIFLNDTTWKAYANCKEAEEVFIFAFSKIFTGTGTVSLTNNKLNLISPKLNIKDMKILQKGVDGEAQNNDPSPVTGMLTGQLCYNSMPKGNKGIQGHGGVQPMDIFLISGLTSGAGTLEIQSIGGNGGKGGNGGQVYASCITDYEEPCEEIPGEKCTDGCTKGYCDLINSAGLCQWSEFCAEYLLQKNQFTIGGEGGLGSLPGQILVLTKRDSLHSIQTTQIHGQKGKRGKSRGAHYSVVTRGIVVDLPSICTGWLIESNDYVNEVNTKLLSDLQAESTLNLSKNPTYSISSFREYTFKAVNVANIRSIAEFWNFMSSHEDVASLYDSKGFAFEAKTVLPLWIPGKTSPIQEHFYTEYLLSAAERIRQFVRTRSFKQPKISCGTETESSGSLCKTILVESLKDAGPEKLKALASLLASIHSQLANIKGHLDNALVIDIDSFMDLAYERIEDYKKNKDMAEGAIKMREANERYRNSINKKIEDASNIIKTQLQPEIDNLNGLIEKEINLVILKLKDLIEQPKKNKAELQKYSEQAQCALIVHSFFEALELAGGIVGLFGPMGAAVGGAISAGAGAANAIYDAVEGFPPLDRVKQVGKETSESNTKIEAFLENHQAEKLKHVDDLFNEAQAIFDSTLTIPSNARKVFTEKRAQHDLLRSSGNPDFEKMRQIRNEIRENFEVVAKSGKTAHVSTALAFKEEEKPENSWKSQFETIGKSLKIVEDSATLYTKLKGDYDAIQLCDNAIGAADKQIENYRKVKDYANSFIRPMVSDVQDLTKKYANGELQDDSLAEMDVAGWKMKISINELREEIQDFAGALGVDSTGVVSATKKLSDVMKLVSDIYARMGTWNEQRELGDYMYTLAVSAQNIKIPDELEEWVTEVSRIVERTSVLWFYNKALNALIQFSFPMAHRLQPYMKIPITSNNIDDYIEETQKNFKRLREELKLEKAVVGGGKNEFRRRNIFYDTYSSTPFAFFDAEEHHHGILSLFDQERTTLFADLLDFELPYDALKFYVVDLIFRVREGEPDWEKKDAELQDALAFYSINLTHTGNNYFRFEGKFYVLQTPSLSIVYNYFKLNGEVHGKNAIYEKLEKGEETLSPFTLWDVKLTKLKDDKRADLTAFKAIKVDMLLCGKGTYIHQEIYETGEEFFTENYYMPDETLGNIARNKLEEDSRVLSGNRLLRVLKRGGGYQVVTLDETRKFNPHLLSRPTPIFQSEMLSPNIHRNWGNATVSSGYYHQA